MKPTQEIQEKDGATPGGSMFNMRGADGTD
jgi:hypothetical protein